MSSQSLTGTLFQHGFGLHILYRELNFEQVTHRAMFKLGGKKLFVLCLLVKNVSAANSADRCNFKESEKVAQDLNRIGGDISSDDAQNCEHFDHF